MRRTTDTKEMERLVREAGEDWLIDWYAPTKDAVKRLSGLIESTCEELAHVSESETPRPTAEYLAGELSRNPHRVRAFLQALGSAGSASMLAMVWLLLQDWQISSLNIDYLEKSLFAMKISLRSPGGDSREFVSNDIDDFALLRHLGIMKVNDRGILDGFYPLRVR